MNLLNIDKLTESELSEFVSSLYDESKDTINCDTVRTTLGYGPTEIMKDLPDMMIHGYGLTLAKYAYVRLRVLEHRRNGETDRARRAERHMDAEYEALPTWLKW